jgi:hypothetical protein
MKCDEDGTSRCIAVLIYATISPIYSIMLSTIHSETVDAG